ncbi:MAG: hypothetical protein AAGE52_25750 [Myxococcota bacterium]
MIRVGEPIYAGFVPAVTRVSDSGALTIYNPAHCVSLTVFRGHMDSAHADAIIRYADQLIARQSGQHFSFHDYLYLTSYDSAARIKLTQWGKAAGVRVPHVHVLQRSKIVAMGVAAAGLALSLVGTTLHSYSNRDDFVTVLTRHIDAVC